MKTITTYKYTPVKLTHTYSGKCSMCGKITKRQVTFEQTINPWNKNKNGIIKTEQEIYRELRAEALGCKLNFTHQKCMKSHSPNRL